VEDLTVLGTFIALAASSAGFFLLGWELRALGREDSLRLVSKTTLSVIVLVLLLVSFCGGIFAGYKVKEQTCIDIWDKAAKIRDEFSGYEITEGRSAEGDWVHGSLAERDAIIDNFIRYRAEYYGEIWKVRNGPCCSVFVRRVA